MADQYQNLSPEDFAQQQAITRQQRLATMLMSQNQQPQGQMISGRYVAPSFFQNILPLVNAYVGKSMLEEGDTQQMKLAEAIRGRNATEVQDIISKNFGTSNYKPAVMPMIARDDEGNLMPPDQAQVGQAPNPDAAFMAASQARSPQGQALFQTLLANKMKPPELINVPQGGTVGQRKADGTFETLYQAPEKAEKPPVSYQEYLLAKNDPIDPFKGSYNQYQTMEANRKTPKTYVTTNIMGDQKTFENTTKLRGMFGQEPIYKAFQEVKSAYKQVEDGLKMESPAGDLAAATKFMKLLDPNSVVRESELALAMQAGGALDRLQNYAQNVTQGTKLTPTQRADFAKLSKQFYNSAATQFNSKQKEYVDIAERYKFNPLDVTGSPIEMVGTEPPQYGVNPKTKERIVSVDGGKTWKPVK
jgi:hypothetical protein